MRKCERVKSAPGGREQLGRGRTDAHAAIASYVGFAVVAPSSSCPATTDGAEVCAERVWPMGSWGVACPAANVRIVSGQCPEGGRTRSFLLVDVRCR